jgi:phosphocarrier protein
MPDGGEPSVRGWPHPAPDPAPRIAQRTVRIINPLGLHMRAAEKLVRTAQRFQADIRIIRDGRDIDGKSVLGLLMLAAACGSRLELRADGTDAEAALDALAGLIERGFDEA